MDGEITETLFNETNFTSFFSLCKMNRKDQTIPDKRTLISNELITENGKIKSGFLLFSDYSQEKDSLICCRLWKGLNKGSDEVIDKKEFFGPLGETYNFASSFISRSTKTGFIKQNDGGRLDTFSYPKIAIREALINAIAHRDYTIGGTQIDIDIFPNRIEISSPGNWLLNMNPKKYNLDKVPSVRRNPVISNAFSLAGLMEKSGSGLKKIATSYEDFGEKFFPILEAYPDFFVITLFDLLYVESDITKETFSIEDKKSIVLSLCQFQPRTRNELQKACGYRSRSMFYTKIMKPLLESNMIVMTEPIKSKKQKYIISK